MDRETIVDVALRRTEDVDERNVLIIERLISIIKNAEQLARELKGLLSDYQKHEIDEDTIAEWTEVHLTTFNDEIGN